MSQFLKPCLGEVEVSLPLVEFPLLEILFHASVNFTVFSILSIIHEFSAIQFYKAKEGKHRYVFPFENKTALASVERKAADQMSLLHPQQLDLSLLLEDSPKTNSTVCIYIWGTFYTAFLFVSVYQLPEIYSAFLCNSASLPSPFLRQLWEPHTRERGGSRVSPDPTSIRPASSRPSHNTITFLHNRSVSNALVLME